MHLHTYRARSLAEALRLVRENLGPDASVLQTREVGGTLARWLGGMEIEVTASTEIRAPSRLPTKPAAAPVKLEEFRAPPAELLDFRAKFRSDLRRATGAPTVIEELAHARPQVPVAGPIRLTAGRCHAVVLVGPTGVGKTTTIAKLAAQFRVCERKRVALVTIDTYRIAAVEQLRTYAEIMDLPLTVVATPREMRAARQRLAEYDLALIDTAGRAPRDAARLNELSAVLREAQADEIHAVLSAVASPESLETAARAFGDLGARALIVTKLDEAGRLDWLPRFAANHRLPLSYVTSGQNVPDDIRPATADLLN
ncbi:MAG: GTPase [Pirellulaceae bacterium]|nr:GTPase [Pirellulaceae bacterium]